MDGAGERRVKAWGVAAVVAGAIAVWQWPDIRMIYDQTTHARAEASAQRDYSEKAQAEGKAKDDATKAEEKRVGYKAMIDGLLAKKRLSRDEHAKLGDVAQDYALELTHADPSASAIGSGISFDDHGNVKSVVGHEAYFAKIYKKVGEPYGDAPESTSVASAEHSSTPASTGAWHTVAHYAGRGTKNTPRFTVPAEWRIRWKARGDGVFQIYAYGPDGMPQVAANAQGSGGDESSMHDAGSFYLTINTTEPYEVWVEAQ